MKSRRFQLVIPEDAFAVMQRMQAHYGGSLSSVVRRGVRVLERLANAREKRRRLRQEAAPAAVSEPE